MSFAVIYRLNDLHRKICNNIIVYIVVDLCFIRMCMVYNIIYDSEKV